jgi:hypothetical protein
MLNVPRTECSLRVGYLIITARYTGCFPPTRKQRLVGCRITRSSTYLFLLVLGIGLGVDRHIQLQDASLFPYGTAGGTICRVPNTGSIWPWIPYFLFRVAAHLI